MLIDAYVERLGAVLYGPRRVKAELLAEVRDGLWDAAWALQQRGVDPQEAEAQAVRDFGDVELVARECQRELAAVQGRRTAIWLAAMVPASVLVTSLLWLLKPQWGVPPQGTWHVVIAKAIDWLGIISGIAGAVVYMAFSWIDRFRVDPARLTRGLGIALFGFLGLQGLLGMALTLLSLRANLTPHFVVLMVAGIAATGVLTSLLAWSARSCLAAARQPSDHPWRGGPPPSRPFGGARAVPNQLMRVPMPFQDAGPKIPPAWR